MPSPDCTMSMPGQAAGSEAQTCGQTVLDLLVNNHPGVMSHVCGLFSRRAYNLEAIVVVPVGQGEGALTSRMWLLVGEDSRLDQIVSQVEKLEDVIEVRRRENGHEVFARLGQLLCEREG